MFSGTKIRLLSLSNIRLWRKMTELLSIFRKNRKLWNLSVLNVGGVVNVSIFNGQGTNMYFRQLIAMVRRK